MKPGEKVIIRQNPHDPTAVNIVGTVIVFRKGAGFAGSDLVDLHYKHPATGKGFTFPFALACLSAADSAALISLAERYERLAAQFRVLAKGR